MKSLAVLPLFAVSLGFAQTIPDLKLPPNVRLYEPKHLEPERARRVATSLGNLVGGVSWEDPLHAFVIRGNTAEAMDIAEALLKRYDVPEPRVELIVHLIRASLPSASAVPGLPTNPVPVDLKAAIDEMKGAFNYDRYTLWDTILLQPKGNGGDTRGILPSEPGARPYVYTVSYAIRGAPTEGKTLNLMGFNFSVKMPQPKEDLESRINTDITVREGQKLVLGKIRLLPCANADLFLVLTTKVY